MHVCALVTQRTSASLFTHMHTLWSMWRIIMDIYAQTHTPVHASKTLASTLIHTCLDTSPSIPQLSAPITYRTFSFTIRLTCLCISRLRRGSVAPRLTSQHCPFLIETQLRLSLPVCQSVSQPGSQSIHKLPTPATDAHSQKWKKKETPREEYPMERSKSSATEERRVWFLGLSV